MSVTLDLYAVRSVRTLSEATRAVVGSATNWLLMAEPVLVTLFSNFIFSNAIQSWCELEFQFFCFEVSPNLSNLSGQK